MSSNIRLYTQLFLVYIITISSVNCRLGRTRAKTLKDSKPSLIDLNGNFTYCDVNNLKSMVNLNADCQPELKAFAKTQVNVEVLTKLHYVLDTKGFECYRKKVVRYLNTSFFGGQSESFYYVESPLSPVECLAMVESKRCNGQLMECTDDGCIFDQLPEGQFAWFQDVKLSNFNCKFHRREIQAEKNTSSVFSNARSSCFPPDFYCQLPKSIVIWKNTDVRRFMYGHIFRGYNYTLSGNILYSKADRYLFQLTDTVKEDIYEFHKTTEGLFVFLLPVSAQQLVFDALMDELPYGHDPSYMPKMASLFDLQLAESDFQFDSIQDEFQKKIIQEFVKDCAMFLNNLQILTKFEDQLHRVRDLNDNEAILYSKFGQLFFPRCEIINNVTISQYEDECFVDTPVEIFDRESNRNLTLFLNKKNFLVDYSPRLKNCTSVNTRQMINNTHFLIRVGHNVKVNQIADLKIVDLTSQNYNFDNINFDHHSQIIDGFDLINDFHERHKENENDMDDHYHILPEDNIDEKHNVINEMTNKIAHEVGAWWNSIMSSIRSFFFTVICVLGLIALIFFFYMARSRSQMPGIYFGSSPSASSTSSTSSHQECFFAEKQND